MGHMRKVKYDDHDDETVIAIGIKQQRRRRRKQQQQQQQQQRNNHAILLPIRFRHIAMLYSCLVATIVVGTTAFTTFRNHIYYSQQQQQQQQQHDSLRRKDAAVTGGDGHRKILWTIRSTTIVFSTTSSSSSPSSSSSSSSDKDDMSRKNTNRNKSKGSQNKHKQPRFVQQVYSSDRSDGSQQNQRHRTQENRSKRIGQSQQQPPPPPPQQQSRISLEVFSNQKEQNTKRRSPQEQRTQKFALSSSSRQRRSPPPPVAPWKTQKSLEELEDIMTKRWGTDALQWQTNANEEYDDDDDDHEDNDHQDNHNDFYNNDDNNFRIINNNNRKNNKNGDDDDSNYFFRKSSSPSSSSSSSPSSGLDYYDEDDEGYERTSFLSKTKNTQSNDRKKRIDLEHIIAPTPAGGRGTTREGHHDHNSDYDNQYTSAKTTGKKKDNDQVPTPAVPPPRYKPMLDQNANPMLLTLQQAQNNFQHSVSANDDHVENYPLSTSSTTSTWEELGITSPILLANLRDHMECTSPLPVQEKSCPPIIAGNDVVMGTYTGSGKTLAFLAPLVQNILHLSTTTDQAPAPIQVIIVAPGRELASQIATVAKHLLQGTGLDYMLAIGGTTFNRNLQQIRKKKPIFLIGTPGRIAELIVGRPDEKSGRLKIANLRSLVLDEFDALLEYKPHKDPTQAILTTLQKRFGHSLQSILCSATATDIIHLDQDNQKEQQQQQRQQQQQLLSFLRPGYVLAMTDQDDILVGATNLQQNDTSDDNNSKLSTIQCSRTVIHGIVHVPHRRLALETLRRILHTQPLPQQILVFVENARRVDIVVEKLGNMGILAAPLRGGRNSEKLDRAEVSRALRDGTCGLVVATELAARGIDAPYLTHVINLDLPTDASHYAHRAGRVGRGGRPGVVINITTHEKERNVPMNKFAKPLGISSMMYTVQVQSGKLNIIMDE